MSLPSIIARTLLLLALAKVGNFPSSTLGAGLEEGEKIVLAGRQAVIRRVDMLPVVVSDYTKRFKFDSFENPKLRELRERYKLDEVIAPGRDEFEKQVLLLDWTHRQFRKFGHPSTNAKGALEILHDIREGETFFCSQYAQVFVSCAASLGWVDRPLALRRHQGAAKGGSTEHTSTEIWSNQHKKWVMLDPTSNMYLEKDGVPLNAFEIRQEWFYENGAGLVFVIGKEGKRYKKSDLPIFLKRFEGFGNLTVDPDELDKYGFTAYIPNTDLMDSGFDYGKMFIVKDQLCEGTRWHERTVPKNPAVDPYFPINQAEVRIEPKGAELRVALKTMTPNFKAFERKIDFGLWEKCGEEFAWHLKQGRNLCQARAVNEFGISGPVSTVEIDLAE